VLATATTGFTFCTQDCTTSADCPAGTGCAADVLTAQLPNECLKTCTTDADCSGGFICRADIATAGSFCWSPFPPPVDAGPDADAAAPDTGAADTGAPEAGEPDASDAGASTSDASDAASE